MCFSCCYFLNLYKLNYANIFKFFFKHTRIHPDTKRHKTDLILQNNLLYLSGFGTSQEYYCWV